MKPYAVNRRAAAAIAGGLTLASIVGLSIFKQVTKLVPIAVIPASELNNVPQWFLKTDISSVECDRANSAQFTVLVHPNDVTAARQAMVNSAQLRGYVRQGG